MKHRISDDSGQIPHKPKLRYIKDLFLQSDFSLYCWRIYYRYVSVSTLALGCLGKRNAN